MNTWPLYEALDHQGLPYMREARLISELPESSRIEALQLALLSLSEKVGIEPVRNLKFGIPAHYAFGINSREASKHHYSGLLQTIGADISLDYITKR